MDTETIINTIISGELDEIEKKEKVHILHCVESGSRAWGFASPDSDFDVRFIYVRQKNFYLQLNNARDVIEGKLNDTLDINGWDLKKALILLHKSNPTIFEWKNSPIIYRTTPEWDQISPVIDKYFQGKSALFHYLNTAKHNYKDFLQGKSVRLKKYFYALRPILACRWILENNSPPPMLFTELADACLDKGIFPVVSELLNRKRNTEELGEGKRIDDINEYICRSIGEFEAILTDYPKNSPSDWSELNHLFLKILK